jgi:myo-inositol-1(or 4)-monophosphatase
MLDAAQEAMRIALDVVRSKPLGRLTFKDDRDSASEVDYEVEDRVRAFLARETPEIGFLGEERGGDASSADEWVLDPLDGTSNFVHGLPLYGVSLALIRGSESALGLVSLPALGLAYSAEKGKGARCNGSLINASKTDDLARAMVSIGDYAVGEGARSKNSERLAMTTRLIERVERLRMVGSAATDLTWVAHGKLDATVILSNKPWDTAAGTLIAREAGALTVDMRGEPHSLKSLNTVAVSPSLLEALLPLLPSDSSGATG